MQNQMVSARAEKAILGRFINKPFGRKQALAATPLTACTQMRAEARLQAIAEIIGRAVVLVARHGHMLEFQGGVGLMLFMQRVAAGCRRPRSPRLTPRR